MSIRGIVGATLLSTAVWGCGPSAEGGADATVLDEECSTPGETRCVGNQHQLCGDGGNWIIEDLCDIGLVCDSNLGCVDCRPSDLRTCVGDTVHECDSDGSVGDAIETCELESCSNGNCGGDCAGGTELIYVVDDTYRLLSFDPTTEMFSLIGSLSCPAGTPWPDWQGMGPATPFSMSVDRSGTAWVLYSSGEIFYVDVTDASCQASGFTPGQSGFELFGMGFVSDSPGSADETLHIAGGSSATGNTDFRLGRVDAALGVTEIGALTVPETFGPELTGTGDAKMYGYYPGINNTQISEISKTTAQNQQTWPMPGLGNQIRAWAFAHWGGRFYIFITTTDVLGTSTTSQVQLLDPATGNSNVISGLEDIPYIIVGAGVSTCAPIVVP